MFSSTALTKYHTVLWLKTTKMYCPTVLEARPPKSRQWLGTGPLKFLGEKLFLILLDSGSPRYSLASDYIV